MPFKKIGRAIKSGAKAVGNAVSSAAQVVGDSIWKSSKWLASLGQKRDRTPQIKQQFVEGRFRLNRITDDLIGVQEGQLLLTASDAAGESATLTIDIFDPVSRPGHAQIKVSNQTAGNVKITGATIRGKAVRRLSGLEGFRHDSNTDFTDIQRNGEHKFEIGNNMIVTREQVDDIADYYAKWFAERRHLYTVQLDGAWYWLTPGEWYRLRVQLPNGMEDIDSFVQCMGVETHTNVSEGFAETVAAFREVEESWEKTSKYTARFIASGKSNRLSSRSNIVTVGSSTYTRDADYLCDGVDDAQEIQQAVDYLMGAFGGGTVQLSRGLFHLGNTRITVQGGSVVFRGEGADATLVTRVSGPPSNDMFRVQNLENAVFEDMQFFGGSSTAIYCDNADSVGVYECHFINNGTYGIRAQSGGAKKLTVHGCLFEWKSESPPFIFGSALMDSGSFTSNRVITNDALYLFPVFRVDENGVAVRVANNEFEFGRAEIAGEECVISGNTMWEGNWSIFGSRNTFTSNVLESTSLELLSSSSRNTVVGNTVRGSIINSGSNNVVQNNNVFT